MIWLIKVKPIAQIVCWNCRQGNIQLFNIKNEQGKKTEDYVCLNCKDEFPVPPVENMSKNYFHYDDETVKTVTLEGDKVT